MAVARQYIQDTQINHGTSVVENVKMTDVMPIQHTDVSSNVNQIHKINFAQTMCEPYAVCNSNNPANGAYTATCLNFPDFALSYLDSQGQTQTLIGMKIRVMFTYGVSYGSVSGNTYPTLNINGSGAIPLLAQGKTMAKGAISAGQTVEFTVIPYGNVLAYDADTNVREKTADYTIYVDGTKRVDSVTSDGTDMVTSRAIYSAIDKVKDIMSSLPTDAVLHYSFDEVPDYPNGEAVYRKNNDFSTTSDWQSSDDVTVTLVDNCIKLQSDGTRAQIFARNNIFTTNNLKGRVVMVKFTSTFSISRVGFQPQSNPYPWYYLSEVKQNGNEYTYIGILPSDMLSGTTYIAFVASSASADNAVTISAMYIGDGTYSTPIIDNANGQNNATNNGGIAVQGVSGKSLLGLGKKNIVTNSTLPKPTDKSSITLSIWVKYTDSYNDTGTRNLFGTGSYNGSFLIMQFCSASLNSMQVIAFVRQDGTHQRTISVKVTRNEWHNAVMVWENKLLTFYIDGIKYTTSALDVSDFTFGSTVWRIGDTGVVQGSEPSKIGNIEYYVDDAQIFDRALTDDEVTALYLNKANTPKYYPPVPLPE